MTRTAIEDYWRQFLRLLPADKEKPRTFLEAFAFGTTRQDASEIARLVIAGKKTTTGSLKWIYDEAGKPVPKTGDFSIVVDSRGRPACVIETTDAKIVPFDEVDAQFAREGGEGDGTLESWRRMYWTYIKAECGRIKRRPSAKTPIVCERFRVVYKARSEKRG